MEKHCIGSLFYTLEQTSRACRAVGENYFAENAKLHLSLDEFIILETVLCDSDICQRDLAKRILKGTSHTSKLLSGLQQKGLIERFVDTKGNRIVKKIVVTEKGREIYDFANKIMFEYVQKIENAIGKEQAIECTNFLNKIKEVVMANTDIIFE